MTSEILVNLSTDTSRSASSLDEALKPYLLTHHSWWSRLLDTRGLDGWVKVAAQHYYVMKLAPLLLDFTASQARQRGPSHGALADWCEMHAEEERPHHAWFASDLAFAGVTKDALDQTLPENEILNLMGGQFALVGATDPFAILGFFFAMECHPNDASAIRSLGERLRIPQGGLRTILFHVDEDLEHAAPIRDLVEKYSDDPLLFAAMSRAATTAYLQWGLLFRRYALQT